MEGLEGKVKPGSMDITPGTLIALYAIKIEGREKI